MLSWMSAISTLKAATYFCESMYVHICMNIYVYMSVCVGVGMCVCVCARKHNADALVDVSYIDFEDCDILLCCSPCIHTYENVCMCACLCA